MKRTLLTVVFLLVALAANVASAYEYHLRYAPPAGGRLLGVAGYKYAANTVIGSCNYSVSSACSGRGCHSVTTYYYNTCTWDLFGNLLSVATGPITAPPVIATVGYETEYALNPNNPPGGTTGRDTRGFGYVDTPSPHYSWQTTNGAYYVIPDASYLVSATLVSDGDLALNISAASVAAQVSGTITPTPGTATIGNSCVGSLVPGATCTVTATYDPTSIACTGSPYGYAYTGIDLSLTTNSGTKADFTQRYTVTGVRICDE